MLDRGMYEKRPMEVEAIRWDGKHIEEAQDFCSKLSVRGDLLFLDVNGIMYSASEGDWVVKHPDSGYALADNSFFQAVYRRKDA